MPFTVGSGSGGGVGVACWPMEAVGLGSLPSCDKCCSVVASVIFLDVICISSTPC